MKFIGINKYKYIKYVVKIECHVNKGQVMTKDEKRFDKIDDAIYYIKKLAKEIKKYPELYQNGKIIMDKIKTESGSYEVTEGE